MFIMLTVEWLALSCNQQPIVSRWLSVTNRPTYDMIASAATAAAEAHSDCHSPLSDSVM